MAFTLSKIIAGTPEGISKWELIYSSPNLKDTLSALYNETLRLAEGETIRLNGSDVIEGKTVGVHHFEIHHEFSNCRILIVKQTLAVV